MQNLLHILSVLVALVIQHAKRMRRIMSSMACPTLSYFSTLSHKWQDFRKNLLNIKCVFWFSLQTFPILRRTKRDMIKNVYQSSRNVHVILVRFWLNLNFLDRVSKNFLISNFKKIWPVGAELFHADEGMDRLANLAKLIVAFCNIANAPKNEDLLEGETYYYYW